MNPNLFSLDVIIPVKDRVEIEQCLRSWLAITTFQGKIWICDGGSTQKKYWQNLEKWRTFSQVQILHFPQHLFNKSQLINFGLQYVTGDYVVISDADIIWNEATLSILQQCLIQQFNCLYFIQKVRETQPQSVALKRDRYTYSIQQTPEKTTLEIIPDLLQSETRPGCGLIGASRQLILSLGGYKEIFTGWGWEDQDLLIRARLFGMDVQGVGEVQHLSHSDTLRNQDYGQLTPQASRNANILASLGAIAQGHLYGALHPSPSLSSPLKNLVKNLEISYPSCLKALD